MAGEGGGGLCTETKDHPMASHSPDEPGSLSLGSLSPPHSGSGDIKEKAAMTKLGCHLNPLTAPAVFQAER